MRKLLLIIIFAVVLAASIIARTPLGFAMEQAGLKAQGVSYSHVAGTIWNGRLHGVDVAGQSIGDVTFKLKPAALLTGALAFDLGIDGLTGAGRGSGKIGLNRTVSIENAIADINIQTLARLDPRLRQAPAQLTATIKHLEITGDGACRKADGVISTDILTSLGGRYAWEGPPMSGPVSCHNNALRIVLQNDGGPDDITASVDLHPSGVYDVTARMQTTNTNVRQALLALQFENRDGAYFYTVSNRPELRSRND